MQDYQKNCESFNLKSLIKNPRCFKNLDNPTCIDLILSNKKSVFQYSTIIEARLSDFHKLTVTVLKSYFKELESKKLTDRDYKILSNQQLRAEL